MALIERLESDDWPEVLRRSFEYTLEVLKNEPFRSNRHRLLDLMAEGVLAATKQQWLSACGFTESDLEDLWRRMLAGERPFEDWMHAHGRSDEEIAEVYRRIDEWLMQRGIIHPPEFGTAVH